MSMEGLTAQRSWDAKEAPPADPATASLEDCVSGIDGEADEDAWMSPSRHPGNIVDTTSTKDINTAPGPNSPTEAFWRQFSPKDAQKMAKLRAASMAAGEEQSCSDDDDGDEPTLDEWADYGWIDECWNPRLRGAAVSWFDPDNLAEVRMALIAALRSDRRRVREFLDDEDREVAATIPAAALVAAAAGNAAATVATAVAAVAASWAAAAVAAEEDEDDEAGRRAALVAAAAGSAAATVAAASAVAAAAVVAAVAAEDAETKKHMPSAEDAVELAEIIRAGSFHDNGITE
jgi:hypothetical protein